MEISAALKPTGNIAIVEDDTSMREALSFQLETAGHRVVAHPSAESSLAHALQNTSTAYEISEHHPLRRWCFHRPCPELAASGAPGPVAEGATRKGSCRRRGWLIIERRGSAVATPFVRDGLDRLPH